MTTERDQWQGLVDHLQAEIDRLHAQVERDRPVIEAARAWAQWRNEWGAVPNWVERPLLDAVAAFAPDEVNPDDVSLESLFPQELIDELGACAPDEVNDGPNP
jgi:hypothetical protein